MTLSFANTAYRRWQTDEWAWKTNVFKVTVRTQQCVNIRIVLWQQISIILEHLQTNVPRYEVESVSYLWMLVWRWSNNAETRCHNKIPIFIHCCVLMVTLKHFVLPLEYKHNGMFSIKIYTNINYSDKQSKSDTTCEFIVLFTRCSLEVTTCFGLLF
jgi:hypothetical protein